MTSVKNKLKDGRTVVGTWCVLPSAAAAEAVALGGLDFAIIDLEHGPMSFAQAQEMALALQSRGCAAVVRASRNDENDILRALDIGADGVIVPHIESAQEREKVVRFSKYAPVGARGFSPYTRAGHFQSRPNHTQLENERTLVAIMIESPEALSAIERIMDDPVVDVVYIGTYDISCALGLAGQVSHPKVMDLLTKAVQKINKAGKAAGCMVNSVEDGQKFRQLGIRFLLYDVDAHVLQKDYARFKEGMGANSPGRPKGSKRTD